MDTIDTQDTSDADEASLRSMGEAADAGREVPSTPNEPEQRATGDDVLPDADATPEPENGAGKSTKDPEKKPAEQQQQQDKPKPGEEKPLSKYEAAKQRQDKTWQKINEEKAQLQRDREQLAREREEVARQRQPAKAEPVKDASGYTADEYEAVAEKAIEDGEPDLAKAAYAKAKELRQQEAAQASGAPGKAQQERFASEWKADMEGHLKADPELLKVDSPIAKQLTALFKEEPWLNHIPGGFSKALGVAKLQLQAGKAQGLEVELGKAKAEIARLTKLTSINGGGPAAPSRTKTFDEMSESEMEATLRRTAQTADNSL